jgi:hypothetical protein
MSALQLIPPPATVDAKTPSFLQTQTIGRALVRGETSPLLALSIHVAVEDGFCCAGCLAMGRLAPVPCPVAVAVAAQREASGAWRRSKGGGS